ncbi:MAG: HTH domain-containing protein [Mollicutes bacterium UO1]
MMDKILVAGRGTNQLLSLNLILVKFMTKKLPNTQILRELLERFTQQELADRFGVNEKTIRRHLNPSDKPKQKRGRKEIFIPEVLYALAHYTAYLETTTQKSLARDFSRWMKRPISQPTICRALKRAGIAYKKISYQSLEQLRKKN